MNMNYRYFQSSIFYEYNFDHITYHYLIIIIIHSFNILSLAALIEFNILLPIFMFLLLNRNRSAEVTKLLFTFCLILIIAIIRRLDCLSIHIPKMIKVKFEHGH